MNEVKVNVKPVVLEGCGEFCYNTCGECRFLDYSESNSKGEYYCPYMAKGSFWSYVGASEEACRHFVRR